MTLFYNVGFSIRFFKVGGIKSFGVGGDGKESQVSGGVWQHAPQEKL